MRALTQALKSVRRSPYQALAAVTVLFLTFFVGYSLVLFLLGSAKVLQYFETRPQVTAFFKQNTPLEKLQQYQQQLQQDSYVERVDLISQADALEIYRNQTQDDPLLQELVTADILPPSLEVSTETIDDLAKVAATMQTYEEVDEVVYQQDVIDSLRYWTKTMRQVGAGVLAVFTFASLMVVVLITSMRIASKKMETRVMRLVGATKWYVLRPFLIEGMLYGWVGSSLAWFVIYLAVLYATPAVQGFFGEINVLPIAWEVMLALYAGGAGLALILGFIASLISTRRLFRV